MSRFALLLLFLSLTACTAAPKRAVLNVDGERRVLETRAATVRDLLQEQGVSLGENDRVEPPEYVVLDRNTEITVVRVEIRIETVSEPLAFERRPVRDEALPEGQTRVLQFGANGEARVTYESVFEDGQQTTRRVIGRQVVSPPVPEILALGSQGSLPSTTITGTLVYLTNGNAWVLRGRSEDRRPLTLTGNLDGRVFDLSPNGEFLLFTQSATTGTLNSLWMVDTLILNESPRPLGITNTLYAQWARDGTRAIAYSTGEWAPNAPGWKAHNDLLIAPLGELTGTEAITIAVSEPRVVLPPSNPAPFSWWGTQFDWAPDGRVMAYALADQVGLVNVETGNRRVLQSFAYYRTRADWVWTPTVSWSADSRYVAAALHAPPAGAGGAEDSPLFDLGVLARDVLVKVRLARGVGMWAAPLYSPTDAQGESRIAFGQALNTADTERSLYALVVMDRDGSNRQRLTPPQATAEGLEGIRTAWAPDALALAVVLKGDVWRVDLRGGGWTPLTANGTTRLVRWR